jgi:hypothetical protein
MLFLYYINENILIAKIWRHEFLLKVKRFFILVYRDWWPVVNQARGKTKNIEVTIAPNLLSKEFHGAWGGEEPPDLKKFKEPLTTHDVGLNITPQMTIESLGTLDATKAAGPDEMNNRVLKEARFHLGEVVADLFNTSLRGSNRTSFQFRK